MSLILWMILIGAVSNVLFALRFYSVIRSTKSPALPVDQQEDAVVILAVRGCDPNLKKNLNGLLNQNFRDYRIVVVVDSESDPAYRVLQQTKIESDVDDRMLITLMDPPRSSCSLKCNAIIGAVETLPVETRWVAFVDADVDVYPDWLADLLGPFTNPKICVSTGNQWFEPTNKSSNGAIFRSIWNAGAIVPSVLLEHAWGGSMAVRYEELVDSRLIDDWKTAIVDDGPISNFAKQMNGEIFVSPKIMMVNREDCSNSFATSWITRMLTWSKIYESTFWITLVHASISALMVVGLVASAILALLTLDFASLFFCLLTFVLASALLVGGYWIVRESVSSSLQRRGLAKLKPLQKDDFISLGLRMGIVQLLYLYGCVRAKLSKRICWRGVKYRLKEKSVELVEYRPYESSDSEKSSMSL